MPQLDRGAPHRVPALWARATWWIGVLTYVAATTWAMLVLPERVVAHSGAGGADRWGTLTEHLVLSVLVGLSLLVGLPLLVRQVARPPGTLLSLPYKDYWLAEPERASVFRQRVTEDALVLAGGLGVFLAAVLQVGTVASTDNPTQAPGLWFVVPVIAFVLALLVWLWWVAASSRHRPPSED